MLKPFAVSIYIFSILLVAGKSGAQIANSTTDPAQAQIIYDDVSNFIKAFKKLDAASDSVEILENEYIKKGTPGLNAFIEKYALTAEKLNKAIQERPEDYSALGERLVWLKTQEDSIRQYFRKFKHFVPQAFFPPTYYIVDIGRGIGSGSQVGQLITIDKEAAGVVKSGLKSLIIHELTHLNQVKAVGSLKKYLAIYGAERSLLAITIREGTAEFFTELVTGEYTQQDAYFFTRKNERELWTAFQAEMLGEETGDWMWTKPSNPEQPRDIGYVFGALIVEYYYKNSLDLGKAVTAILSVTDYQAFLEKTGYVKKFTGLNDSIHPNQNAAKY